MTPDLPPSEAKDQSGGRGGGSGPRDTTRQLPLPCQSLGTHELGEEVGSALGVRDGRKVGALVGGELGAGTGPDDGAIVGSGDVATRCSARRPACSGCGGGGQGRAAGVDITGVGASWPLAPPTPVSRPLLRSIPGPA
mgnify:CR=1 FL=1